MIRYDGIIIGFGKGGKALAGFLRKNGKKVALIVKLDLVYHSSCLFINIVIY